MTRTEILDLLFDQRHAAGEPKIGAREVELVKGSGRRAVWPILRALSAEGKITRGSGFCWLTEETHQEMLAGSRRPYPHEGGSTSSGHGYGRVGVVGSVRA